MSDTPTPAIPDEYWDWEMREFITELEQRIAFERDRIDPSKSAHKPPHWHVMINVVAWVYRRESKRLWGVFPDMPGSLPNELYDRFAEAMCRVAVSSVDSETP